MEVQNIKSTDSTTSSIEIKAIPTNIITGFLGVGKTSTILHLLSNKPSSERWAILVNEFGEIGVDASLLEGQQQESGVYIREVPGGCMCCAAGVPMQVALNQLLTSAKPDRLLIEPTGLGHPKEILEILSSEYYRDVLFLQKTLTLVDARKLSDERYTMHDIFNQQIAIADTIVGNKSDLYNNDDKVKLADYIKQKSASYTKVIFTEYGDIHPLELEGKTSFRLNETNKQFYTNESLLLSDKPLPACGFIKAVNKGEGFHSIGWRFSPDITFDYSRVIEFLWDIGAERVKAVFNTDKGMIGFNLVDDVLTELELQNCAESRIEIISVNLNEGIEEILIKCILN